LSNAGFEIHEVTPPLLEETAKTGYSALLGEVQALLGEDIRRNGSEKIQMIFDEYFRQFEPYDGKKLLTAMANRTHYAREWSLFMHEYPLIISNLLPTSFFYPDRDSEGKAGVTEVLGAALWSYSMNFIGHPAGIVPTHIANTTAGPVPIGIQIIGKRWREDTVVAALIAIEECCGTFCEKLWEKLGWLN
jgi:amidase